MTMEDRPLLTVVLPVKNEAKNLPTCLEKAKPLGPLVVVDSGSTDGTQDIAREHGAQVLDFQWDGHFPKKRNWTLRNHTFTSDWVLFLDADEFVTAAFIEELTRTLEDTQHVGFWLNFDNHFLGKRLAHGEKNRKLACFRVGAGEYEYIAEEMWSSLDMEVHEHPMLEGSIGEIKATIGHNDYRGITHFVTKHNEYASWEARRYLRLVAEGKTEWDKLTDRQRTKYAALPKWWFAPAYFVRSYLLQKGFLDGHTGLCFALMKVHYFFTIRLKILEELHRNG